MVKNPEPAPDDPVVRSVKFYKKIRPYLLGDFYPLTAHDVAPTAWFAYQMHRTDLDAGMVMAFRRKECAEESTTLRLHGLSPDRKYEVASEDTTEVRTVTGKELAEWVVKLTEKPAAAVLYYRAVQAN